MKITSEKPAQAKTCLTLAYLASVLAVVGVVSGCGKSSEKPVAPPAPVSSQPEAAPKAAPAPATPKAAPAPASPQTPAEPDLGVLNREVLRWIVRNHREPKSFEEVMASSTIQVPPPPAGKKYVLTKEMKVTLENR